MRRAIAAALIALALISAGGATRAAAHASLLESEPADGAVAARGPAAVRLRFNEPVSPLVLRLVDAEGRTLDLAAAAVDATVTAALPPALAAGTHLLSWRVVSADGHPVGGALTFSVGAPSVARPVAPAAPNGRWAIWIGRVVLYLGLFVGVGGAFYATWIGRRSGRPRAVDAALAAGAVAAAASVGLQGADALGLSWTALAVPRVWLAGLETSFGVTAAVAAAAMACAAAALRVRRRYGRWLGGLALAGVGAALAASGHAGTAGPQGVMRGVVFLHAIGVAFWAGALLPLHKAMGQGGRSAGELLRFSRAIPIPFAVLMASGLGLAVVQLGAVEALWTTAYGRVLLAKLALVLALVFAAAVNRRLTPRAAAGDTTAVRRLRRTVAWETAGVVAVLAVVALWRFTPPPRALLALRDPPAFAHIHTAAAMADIAIAPSPGGRRIAITLLDGNFAPLDAKEVAVLLSAPDAGIEPLRFAAARTKGSTWQVAALPALAAGRWHLRLDILVGDFDRVSLEDDIDLPR